MFVPDKNPDSTSTSIRSLPQPCFKGAYSILEVAAKMGVSRQTITRLFERESGVINIERPEEKHKRGYRTIRIPHAVYERVLRKVSN